MKIGILSRSPRAYSTRRLKEACLRRGHKTMVLNTVRFTMLIEERRPRLFYKNRPLTTYDAVVPRIGASITLYGTAVVRQFEQMGVYVLNSANAIVVSRDKLRSTQMLSRHNVGIATTAFVHDRHSVMPALGLLGGAPVIIKLLQGTQGIGVILADTQKIAEAIVETLQSAHQQVLMQKFVKESKGRDLRAFVVGHRVVAAMRRVATGDEFRSNVHRGGRAERVDLDPEYERTAINAAQIMGLQVAGVDMLEGADGPKIMEVNSSPGLEGIERATGIDVADAIVSHLEQQVSFPELDLRQRLTLSAGYRVAEVPLTDKSALVRKTLRECGLRELDVQVLSISRGGLMIPNPRGDRELLPGDTLLCYGKEMTLRGLLPTPTAKKKKKKKRTESALADGEDAS